MNTRLTIGILTVIVLLLGVFVFINIAGGNIPSFFSPLFQKTGKVTINKQTFTVFVAKTEKEKEIGLSGRNSIGDKQGMIFTFDKPDYYGFWMRNMKFSIDIVYLNNKQIVSIFPNVPYPKDGTQELKIYTPTSPADTVVEFKAGTAEKNNFQVGDTATISL